MSTLVSKNVQVGTSGTATDNFTIFQPATPDGTLRIGNGNAGITTSLLTLTSTGAIGVGGANYGTSGQFLQSNGTAAPSWVSAPIANNGTLTMNVSGTGLSGSQTFTANQSSDATFTVTSNATSANTGSTIVARDASGNFSAGTITATLSGTATQVSNNLTLATSGTGLSGSATFNGASAQTFTVTSNATNANTGSTIVARDASGNFSAGTITATLNGNAATATTLQTTRAINAVNFNGSADITIPRVRAIDDRIAAPADGATAYATFGFGSWNNNNSSPYSDFWLMRSYTDGSGGADNMVSFRKDALGMRVWQQTYGSSTAFTSYKDVAWTDGTNASGTWGINITGNAASVGGYAVANSGSANTIPLRNGSGYLAPYNWVQFDGFYGIFSPNNSAHFYPNNLSYGSWRIDGTRNGWYGIEFGNQTTLMMNDDSYGFHRNIGGAWRFYVSGGSGYFPGNITAYWSDERLKENLRKMNREALDILGTFTAYRFNWNAKVAEIGNIIPVGKEEIGLIAQQVQKRLPDAVVVNKAGAKVGQEDFDYLTINYDRITPLLVEGVNIHEEEIAALKARVAQLESLVNRLIGE